MADGVPTVEELLALSGEGSQGQTQSVVAIEKEDAALTYAAMQVSEPSFARVWDNPEDDVYNDL